MEKGLDTVHRERQEGLPGQDLGGFEEVSVTVSPIGSFPTLDPAVSRGGCNPITPLLIKSGQLSKALPRT